MQVGDPALVKTLAQDLLEKHKIYVQPINYPTVPRGQELLRVAPTPHHTKDMMNHFVNAALSVWIDNGQCVTAHWRCRTSTIIPKLLTMLYVFT